MTALEAMGWGPDLAAAFAGLEPDLVPMRVVLAERGAYRASDGEAEAVAVVSGRLRHRAAPGALPVVGDWIAMRAGVIEAVLPRRTFLARRDPDRTSDQVLVANIDIALVVMGLDGDYSLRRLERYLTMVGAAGVRSAAVLSKADLYPAAERLAEVAAAAPDVPVVAADLTSPSGPRAVEPLLAPGATAVLLGSSGAGKSTLINGLLGEAVQRTAPVRAHDSRGRHTTTRRQLFRLPGGALVIDTPGLRELEPSHAAAGLDDSFPDLAEVAARCRFRDCRHQGEPDCAVAAAVAAGTLSAARVAAYHKLIAEPDDRRRR